MPAYLQFALGSAAVVVSVCAVLVSRAQWKVASTNLQLQLFDRRLQIKEVILDLASSFFREGRITTEAFGQFHSKAFACRYLHPDNAATWIKTLDGNAYRFLVLGGQLKMENERPQRDDAKIERLNREEHELVAVFQNLFNEADAQLDPHLKIQQHNYACLSALSNCLKGICWRNDAAASCR